MGMGHSSGGASYGDFTLVRYPRVAECGRSRCPRGRSPAVASKPWSRPFRGPLRRRRRPSDSARAGDLEHARAVGRGLAERGAVVLTGGMNGVMQAAARGAHRGRRHLDRAAPGAGPGRSRPREHLHAAHRARRAAQRAAGPGRRRRHRGGLQLGDAERDRAGPAYRRAPRPARQLGPAGGRRRAGRGSRGGPRGAGRAAAGRLRVDRGANSGAACRFQPTRPDQRRRCRVNPGDGGPALLPSRRPPTAKRNLECASTSPRGPTAAPSAAPSQPSRPSSPCCPSRPHRSARARPTVPATGSRSSASAATSTSGGRWRHPTPPRRSSARTRTPRG